VDTPWCGDTGSVVNEECLVMRVAVATHAIKRRYPPTTTKRLDD